MNKTYAVSIVSVAALALAQVASAHAVVSPKQGIVAAYQEYSLAVPSEKDANTTSVRLLIPGGISVVTPNVTQGWTVAVKDDASGNATEIDWTKGVIPTGERQDFQFQIQNPANPTTLDWKVYQSYSDGSTVAWDQDPTGPNGTKEASDSGPYSETMISAAAPTTPATTPNYSLNALILATIALVIGLFSLVFTDYRIRNK